MEHLTAYTHRANQGLLMPLGNLWNDIMFQLNFKGPFDRKHQLGEVVQNEET